jgi:hypothetical protein
MPEDFNLQQEYYGSPNDGDQDEQQQPAQPPSETERQLVIPGNVCSQMKQLASAGKYDEIGKAVIGMME